MSSTEVSRFSRDEGLNRFRHGLEHYRDAFASALGDRMDVEHFIEVATTAYMDPKAKLASCDPASLMHSLFRASQLRLRPDGVEGAIIPRGRQARFEPMYQGIVRTMLRTGTVRKIESRVVKTGDLFEYEYGITPKLRHIPGKSQDRGGTVAVYAIAFLTSGDTQFEVMDFEETEHVRRISKQQNGGREGPAWTNYPDEMRRKIVVKRLAKYLEQTPELAAVVQYDNALDHGLDIDPADIHPEVEHRTADERARDHADRQTEELRAAMGAYAAGEEEPDEVANEPDPSDDYPDAMALDEEVTFGKYKGHPWRAVFELDRGYVTHWALTDKCEALEEDFKQRMRDEIHEIDERGRSEADEPDDDMALQVRV